MKITSEDLRRIIKEELQAVMDEDLSMLGEISPNQALQFMKDELNGKTWVFWDLETIGFNGQITQFAAFSYHIEDISQPPPADPVDKIVIKCSLTPETAMQQQEEREQLKDPNSDLSMKKQKHPDRPFTVDDMLAYTHYDDFEPDAELMPEEEALKAFVAWFNSQEDKISVGHNILSFDRKRIIEQCSKYGIDSSAFEEIDIFDTVRFARTLFKKAMMDAAQRGDEQAEKMYVVSEKGKKKMSMKLEHLMNVFGDPNRIQIHTADDDTKQLVDVFFRIYKKVENVLEANPKSFNMVDKKDIHKLSKQIAAHMYKTGQANPDDPSEKKALFAALRQKKVRELERMVIQIRRDPDAILEV